MILPYHVNLALAGLDQGHYLTVTIHAEELAAHTGDRYFTQAAAICVQLAGLIDECIEEQVYPNWDPSQGFNRKGVVDAIDTVSSSLQQPRPEWHLENYESEDGVPYSELREELLQALPTLREAVARLDTVWYGPWRALWLGEKAGEEPVPPAEILPGSVDRPEDGFWIEVGDDNIPRALCYVARGEAVERLVFGKEAIYTRILTAQAKAEASGREHECAKLYDLVQGEIERMSKKNEQADELSCSFCSRPQSEVRKIIAGPACYICDQCVDLCNDILADELSDDEHEETPEEDDSGGSDEEDGGKH